MCVQARLKSEKFATALVRQRFANCCGSKFFTFHSSLFTYFPYLCIHKNYELNEKDVSYLICDDAGNDAGMGTNGT